VGLVSGRTRGYGPPFISARPRVDWTWLDKPTNERTWGNSAVDASSAREPAGGDMCWLGMKALGEALVKMTRLSGCILSSWCKRRATAAGNNAAER
jgi:hypothetical protein